MREKATIRIFTFHLTLFDGGKGHNPYLYFPFGAIRREKGHTPYLYFQFSPIRREKRPQSVSLLSIWRYSTRENATIRMFTFHLALFDIRKDHNQYLYFPFGAIRQEKRPQSVSLLSIWPYSTRERPQSVSLLSIWTYSTREKATIRIFTCHLALFDKRKGHNPYLYFPFGAIRRGKRPQSVSLLSIWRYSTREKATIRIFTFHLALFDDEKTTIRIFTFPLALFDEGKGHNPYLYFPLGAIR